MKKVTNTGFTLIEIMIIVTIIGILAAIAIPKFGSMMRKTKEGKTKGELGTLRGALTIYYSAMEGCFPYPIKDDGSYASDNDDIVTFKRAPMVTRYLDKSPSVRLGRQGLADSSDCVYCSSIESLSAEQGTSGKWWYRGQQVGQIHIAGCGWTDSKGEYITSW